MKLAIVYICTGKYSIFWQKFYNSSEKFFYPGTPKKYFLFTDDEFLIKSVRNNNKVQSYFQRKAGWPYDTLLRFNCFSTIQDLLLEYDYCYFWNANTVFQKPVNETVIPFPTEKQELVLWRHTIGYDHDRPEQFNAEKNPESEAFVNPGTFCRSYGGGFIGGTARGFVKMSITLRDRIARDLEKGIIATQHDQSHIVKYGSELNPAEVIKDAVVSEEFIEGRNPYVIFENKKKYGGMHTLREMPLSFRISNRLLDSISSILGMLGIKKVIKKIIGK